MEFSWPTPTSGQRENDQAFLRLRLESPDNPLAWVREKNPGLRLSFGQVQHVKSGYQPPRRRPQGTHKWTETFQDGKEITVGEGINSELDSKPQIHRLTKVHIY